MVHERLTARLTEVIAFAQVTQSWASRVLFEDDFLAFDPPPPSDTASFPDGYEFNNHIAPLDDPPMRRPQQPAADPINSNEQSTRRELEEGFAEKGEIVDQLERDSYFMSRNLENHAVKDSIAEPLPSLRS